METFILSLIILAAVSYLAYGLYRKYAAFGSATKDGSCGSSCGCGSMPDRKSERNP